MGGRRRFDRNSLVCFSAAILSLCATAPAAAAGTGTARHQQMEASSMTIHVPIPMTALAEQYASIHQSLAAHRHTHRDWVTLGGGTGFLKYRIWPGEQSSTTTGGRLLSQSSFPFGVEYAKQIKGTVTKIAECGRQDATTGTGRLSVTLATTFSQARAYTLLPISSVTAVKRTDPALLSEQGVDTAPLMAQVYRSELQGMLPTVDRKAATIVTLKPAVTHIWNDLQEPLLLDEAEGLWLQLNPEAIGPAGVEPLSGTPAAGYGVTARPAVVRGYQALITTSPPPRPAVSVSRRRLFTSPSRSRSPSREANQRLREAVVGQEWSLGVGTIKIVGATLYPLGNQVGVELTLRGLLPLTLRLKGTPAYDEAAGRILFRDVDYTIKERTPATDLAEEWLHEPLRDELAGRLVLPIREELDLMRQALEKGLNRNLTGGRLRGRVHKLSLEALTVQTANLSVRFKTEGTLHYDAHADIGAP
jgi:hypothetical protein